MVMFLWWMVVITMPVLAQETLYPVRNNSDFTTVMTPDHSSFVVEKAFEYKLTIGFPSDDHTWFLPNSRTRMVVLFLRIENLSQHAISLNTATFTSVDDDGRTYSLIAPDEAFNRIMAGAGGPTALASKALHGISLGKAGTKPTEEQLRKDTLRYSLQSGQIPSHDIREGLIYFEGPMKKKFTVNIRLGELWSKPFPFSNSKQK